MEDSAALYRCDIIMLLGYIYPQQGPFDILGLVFLRTRNGHLNAGLKDKMAASSDAGIFSTKPVSWVKEYFKKETFKARESVRRN